MVRLYTNVSSTGRGAARWWAVRHVIVAVVVGAVGCGPPVLSLDGEGVRVSPESGVEGCRYVTSVQATKAENVSSAFDNAMTQVRNDAGERGATHLVITEQRAFRCSGAGSSECAMIVASAYSCPVSPRARIDEVEVQPVVRSGGERERCYGNGTCNDGLVCASGLCVRLNDSPTPDATLDQVDGETRVGTPLPVEPGGIRLGTEAAVRAATPTIETWRERYVKLTLKSGAVVRDSVWMLRGSKLFMQDGRDYDLMDAVEIRLVD